MADIERNEAFELAYRFVTETQESVFLTGRAGTGKTTFLKYLREHSTKNMLVAAPTGVAAINAGGVTLHSLFQLPLHPFLPTSGGKQQLLNSIRFNKQRLGLMRKMELLVIDEISMVRSDLLDAIDTILRSVRRNHGSPFGGVQLLLIGDLYQLPPVAKAADRSVLDNYYASPFFFDSYCIREQIPLLIELTTIYRQKEDRFVDLLNKVRNNQLAPADYELLNQRYQRDFRPPVAESWITLTSHNHQADAINQLKLQQLPGRSMLFEARIEDEFPDNIFPADARLLLKEGAQVMFIKNDVVGKKYFNGKIGRVVTLEDDLIVVECGTEKIEVPLECWENTRYTLNRSDEKLEQQVVGRFHQYPLRLAWAITIHKSQGLTFDRVMIDAASSFSSGQVYVALSRCTSLEGIVLLNRIPPAAITTNEEVGNAQAAFAPRGSLAERFRGARQVFTLQLLHKVFVLEEVQSLLNILRSLVSQYAVQLHPAASGWTDTFSQALVTHTGIAEKFLGQVQQMLAQEPMIEENSALQQRVRDAAAYFIPGVEQLKDLLLKHSLETEHRDAASAIDECLQELQVALWRAAGLLEYCRQPFRVTDFLQYQVSQPAQKLRISSYAAARKATLQADVPHPELYLSLRHWRDELCRQQDIPVYLVAANSSLRAICEYLPTRASELLEVPGFGEAKTEKYGAEITEMVQDYCDRYQVDKSLITPPVSTPRRKKAAAPKTEKIPSALISLGMFQQGQTIEAIARERKLAPGTVEGHLVDCIGKGLMELEQYLSSEASGNILACMDTHPGKTIQEWVTLLNGLYSYNQVKAVQAYRKRQQDAAVA